MFGWLSATHGMTRRALATGATVCLLVATLALGACGASTQTIHTPPYRGTTGGSAATATSTASGGVIPGGGMAVRPCPGQVSDATQVGALALTLTKNNSTGSLHVGELAQVRLSATLHWALNSQPTHLTSVGEAGGQDTTLNVCYWTFRAESAGTDTLNFSGTQPCDNVTTGCDQSIILQKFTITVS